MEATNLTVHEAVFGNSPEEALALWQSDFGDAVGFGHYEVELWSERPAELIWVFSGVMTAHVDGRRWVLTPGRAIWIPPDWPSDVVPNRPARAYCLQMPRVGCPVTWTRPTVVAMSPLLGELIHHLGRPGLDQGAGLRGLALLYDLLEPIPENGLLLPDPVDPRVREVTAALLENPGDRRSLAEWGETVHASAKTLQRAFVAETGMCFPDWRKHARLYASLPLLEEGMSVEAVARKVGYDSTNGFILAFRGHFGTTPGQRYKIAR